LWIKGEGKGKAKGRKETVEKEKKGRGPRPNIHFWLRHWLTSAAGRRWSWARWFVGGRWNADSSSQCWDDAAQSPLQILRRWLRVTQPSFQAFGASTRRFQIHACVRQLQSTDH